ncbi:hypothetical protein [Aequoribacter sp.]|uniref:hypothetical protein n=1 Tax=Aequoribacter sp. TaxID=2847771 RepID=UPI003C6F9F22
MLPHPLASGTVQAELVRRPIASAGNVEDWALFMQWPVFCGAGVDTVTLALTVDADHSDTIRMGTLDSSLNAVQELNAGSYFGPGEHYLAQEDYGVIIREMSVTAGEVNVIKVEAWDAVSKPDAASDGEVPLIPDSRVVRDYLVLAGSQTPTGVVKHEVSDADPGDETVPTSFTPVDDNQLQQDDPIGSYMLTTINQGTAALIESLTGQPSGANTSVTVSGHVHADDAATDIDEAGEEIDMCLLSTPYGVARRIDNVDSEHMSSDEVGAPEAAATLVNWRGRIFAPTLRNTTSKIQLTSHGLYVPRSRSASLADSSGKINVYVLARDTSTDPITVFAETYDGSSTGTEGSAATSGAGGLQMLTISGLDCYPGSGSDPVPADRLMLRIKVQPNKSSASAVHAVYGICVAFEA